MQKKKSFTFMFEDISISILTFPLTNFKPCVHYVLGSNCKNQKIFITIMLSVLFDESLHWSHLFLED